MAQTTSTAASFAVNDEVIVVGTRQGGTVVATAVTDQPAVIPAGRPMISAYESAFQAEVI